MAQDPRPSFAIGHMRLAVEDGAEATTIERGNIHDSFSVKGPSGYSIPINSSHVAGAV